MGISAWNSPQKMMHIHEAGQNGENLPTSLSLRAWPVSHLWDLAGFHGLQTTSPQSPRFKYVCTRHSADSGIPRHHRKWSNFVSNRFCDHARYWALGKSPNSRSEIPISSFSLQPRDMLGEFLWALKTMRQTPKLPQ